MSDLLTRVRVLFTALATWLTALAVLVSATAPEIVKVLPDGWRGGFTEGAVRVVAALGAAILIVRRVTPIVEAQRGLLPVGSPQPLQTAPADRATRDTDYGR